MQSTFASMSMSASQNDYNTASHKGLQSYHSISTTVPAPQEPSIKGPLLEPLPLLTRRPVQESKNSKSSDLVDFKTIRPYTDTITAPTKAGEDEAEALKYLGNAAMEKKDFPKAIDLYTKALAIAPGAAVYLINRAAAYLSSKNYVAACADAEAAITADPKYAKTWVSLAAARLDLGDARGSVNAYTKGIEYEGYGGSKGIGKDARRESIQARRQRREEAKDREGNLPEETDAEMRDEAAAPPDTPGAEEASKIYLKGLFSVSTTSNKTVSFIRQDIIRVLRQLGVEYIEIKGGFSCRLISNINSDRVKMTKQPSRRGPSDRSFIINSEESDIYVWPPPDNQINEIRDITTTTRIQSDTGEKVVLKFDIFIVKLPLFSLHGIQFKKVQGGMNQYKHMATRILTSLRL